MESVPWASLHHSRDRLSAGGSSGVGGGRMDKMIVFTLTSAGVLKAVAQTGVPLSLWFLIHLCHGTTWNELQMAPILPVRTPKIWVFFLGFNIKTHMHFDVS